MTEENKDVQQAVETKKKPENSRPTRTPLGARNRLTFDNRDPAYVYRVINDVDDRIERAKAAGYEHVDSDGSLGDERAGEAKKLTRRVKKPVGNGINGYLMRIKREWYDEDQAEKHRRINESERAIRPNTSKGQYGEGLTDS
jgi:hypothetical protein